MPVYFRITVNNVRGVCACGVESVRMVGRKRTVVTLEMKLKIIKDVKGGKSQRLVSDIHSVQKSTSEDIWKGRGKIESYVASAESSNFTKKKRIV